MSAPGRPCGGAGPVGIHAFLNIWPPGSCFHGVVQLRHQTESQVRREVTGPSRGVGLFPGELVGPERGTTRAGGPVKRALPEGWWPALRAQGPRSRVVWWRQHVGPCPVLPIVEGLGRSGTAGYAGPPLSTLERKFQSHPNVPPWRLIELALAVVNGGGLCYEWTALGT